MAASWSAWFSCYTTLGDATDLDRLSSGPGLGHDYEACVSLEHGDQAQSDHLVAVDDKHTQCWRASPLHRDASALSETDRCRWCHAAKVSLVGPPMCSGG
jgi:hypothetical protein